MRALAIDLGGSHANCGIVEERAILANDAIAVDCAEGLRPLLPLIVDTFDQLAKRTKLSLADCKGVAVGFPGLVDARVGRVLSTNAKYEDAPKVDFAAWGREALGLPLRIENDARMALLGECYAGAAMGVTEVVMMTLGTGIGGVAMIEGRGYVIPDDVKRVAPHVLAHRLILTQEALLDGVAQKSVVDDIMKSVKVP